MVQPLDDFQGPLDFHGQNSWCVYVCVCVCVCKVALKLQSIWAFVNPHFVK